MRRSNCFCDTNTGNSFIEKATCTLEDGDTISVEMDPPDDATEFISFDYFFTEVGFYRTCVFGTDVEDNDGPEKCTFLPVYDPNGGYAKGNGWFDSPEGTETGNDECTVPYQTGRAIFAFDCKYKNGVPTGRTEFNYVAGGLHLKSESYDWIVVNKPRAIYQGAGKINGVGSYGFLVSMRDGGRWGKDKIRVKIWDKSDGVVVYDNEPGKDDDAVPSTKKGGGSLRVYSATSPTICDDPPGSLECIQSGGEVTTRMCCKGLDTLPDTCSGSGPCGCAPWDSEEAPVCACPEGKCFDGTKCTVDLHLVWYKCEDSGGFVTTQNCCKSTNPFPNTCLIGPCGCAPWDSEEIDVCACPQDYCFDGNECVHTVCRSPDDPCMNEENWQICMDYVAGGCSNILVLESCPLQFRCGDLHYGKSAEIETLTKSVKAADPNGHHLRN